MFTLDKYLHFHSFPVPEVQNSSAVHEKTKQIGGIVLSVDKLYSNL